MNKPDDTAYPDKSNKKKIFYFLIFMLLIIIVSTVTPVTIIEVKNQQNVDALTSSSFSSSTTSSAISAVPSVKPSQFCSNNASAFLCQTQNNCNILYNCNPLGTNACTLVFQSHPWINLTNLNKIMYFGYTLRMYNNTICNGTYFDYYTNNLVCPQIGNNSNLMSYQSYILLC